jgi:hypothetical protein
LTNLASAPKLKAPGATAACLNINPIQYHSKENNMPRPTIPEPRIILSFNGMVAFCAAERRSYFDAGIIKGINSDIPHHFHSITYSKRVNEQQVESMQLEGEFLRLVIGGQTQMTPPAAGDPGIELFSGDENFKFGLIVDVEKRMHRGDKVRIEKKALRSILRVSGVKNGIFYTDALNEAQVFTTNGSLGLVAFRAKAQISLTSDASIQKYDKEAQRWVQVADMRRDHNVTYKIQINNACESKAPHQDCLQVGVIPFYNALFEHQDPNKRVRFVPPPQRSISKESDPGYSKPQAPPPPTPETGCPLLNFGLSEQLAQEFPG